MKNFAAILAGGVGQRFGNSVPKQFMKMVGIPIIIRTLRTIMSVESFDNIFIAVHEEWIDYFRKLLIQYELVDSRIVLVHGGPGRIDSIAHILSKIKLDYYSSPEDVVVVCDAVRPFVDKDILEKSIEISRRHGACVCATPAIDTMLSVSDGIVISVPQRSMIFHGQAPDSCKVDLLNKALLSLSEEERQEITGTAQILVQKKIPVHIIPGDRKNIKITTREDFMFAEALMNLMGQ